MRNIVFAVAALMPLGVRAARTPGAAGIDNGGLREVQAERTGVSEGSFRDAQAEQIELDVQWWMAIGENSGWL